MILFNIIVKILIGNAIIDIFFKFYANNLKNNGKNILN